MSNTFTVRAVATVHSARTDLADDNWGGVVATLEFDPAVVEDSALAGLADFSHVEVIFLFDRVTDDKIVSGARHPRNNDDWPLVGIFGQRGKNRPNRLGLSRCRIVSVDGLTLTLQGL